MNDWNISQKACHLVEYGNTLDGAGIGGDDGEEEEEEEDPNPNQDMLYILHQYILYNFFVIHMDKKTSII